MRAPQPRTAARLTLTFAWANEQVGRWLVGMTIPFHYAGLGRFFRYLLLDWWPGSCVIVSGTNFARCRCWYRPRRGDRGGKAEP
jgi:hypothetical protein